MEKQKGKKGGGWEGYTGNTPKSEKEWSSSPQTEKYYSGINNCGERTLWRQF